MRFLVFILPKTSQTEIETGVKNPLNEELLRRMALFNRELKTSGVIAESDHFQPLTNVFRLEVCSDELATEAKRFVDAQTVIGGYWILNVTSKKDAIAWMKRCPVYPGDVIEIRSAPKSSHSFMEFQLAAKPGAMLTTSFTRGAA